MAIVASGLSNVRTAFTGIYRFIIGSSGGTIYVERFVGSTNTQAPWYISGTEYTRLVVAPGSVADIDYFQGTLIVDVAGGVTYVSYNDGQTWQVSP